MDSLVFRPACAGDAGKLLEIYAPYVRNTAISFEYDVPSAKEFQERIVSTLRTYPYIIAERDGEPVGYAYAGVFHARKAYECSAELSVYVREDMRGIGVGRLLYEELFRRLKAQSVVTVYACIAATSRPDDPYLTDASIRFHGKLGFALAGRFTRCARKFDLWYDMVYMEKHLDDNE